MPPEKLQNTSSVLGIAYRRSTSRFRFISSVWVLWHRAALLLGCKAEMESLDSKNNKNPPNKGQQIGVAHPLILTHKLQVPYLRLPIFLSDTNSLFPSAINHTRSSSPQRLELRVVHTSLYDRLSLEERRGGTIHVVVLNWKKPGKSDQSELPRSA